LLFDAVAAAAGRGCEVRVLIRNEPPNAGAINALTSAGVQVRCLRYLHEKELVADDRLIFFSSNFTRQELHRNQNAGYEILPNEDLHAAVHAFNDFWHLSDVDATQGEEAWTAAAKVVPAELLAYLQRDRLNPLQARALPVVLSTHGHILVVAPAGAGKTVVGEAAVLRAIVLEHRRGVFLVPSRSLTNPNSRTK
jgi:helicase